MAAVVILTAVAVFASGAAPVDNTNDSVRLEIAGMGLSSVGQDCLFVTYINNGNQTAEEEVKVYCRKEVIANHSVVLVPHGSATFRYPIDIGDNGRATVSFTRDGVEIFGLYPPLCWGMDKCPPGKKPQ